MDLTQYITLNTGLWPFLGGCIVGFVAFGITLAKRRMRMILFMPLAGSVAMGALTAFVGLVFIIISLVQGVIA